MAKYYNPNAPRLRYASVGTQFAVLAAATLIAGAATLFLQHRLQSFDTTMFLIGPIVAFLSKIFGVFGTMILICGVIASIFSVVYFCKVDDAHRIAQQVRAALCCPEYGNPLRLKPGELLPTVKCRQAEAGVYELSIAAKTSPIDDLVKLSPIISSALTGKKYEQYAVTQVISDIAFNKVTYRVEDVTMDKSITFHSVEEMIPADNTKLLLQQGTNLNLKYSGSILAAGKTRSGKTTGIISLLLQVLLLGRDDFGSQVVIIDPKRAELSRLPHVVSVDADGEATQILAAVQRFADVVSARQQVLNSESERRGDAAKWWEIGMHPSYLFIDEFVACRTLFPKKADKNDPDYCLDSFDNLLKRIVTMGASAGCFAIISIAEASVQEGGLPSMLRSAMGTKILFKPTAQEGRLMWDSDKLEALQSDRIFCPGDAWLSSQDGTHDFPAFVHFPVLDFAVYSELGRLLEMYYGD